MGSEVVVESTAETSLKDYFNELFVYALSIGMTYDQFWHDDVDLLVYYHKAEQIRNRKRNQEMWLQGLYIYQAIGNLAPVLNGFVKDHRAKPYLKQPIPITEEDRIEQENQKVLKFRDYLINLSKKGGKKDG